MIIACAAALPRLTPYSHPTSKVLAAGKLAAAASASASAAGAFAAADFSDGNLGPDFSAAGPDNQQKSVPNPIKIMPLMPKAPIQ